MTILTNPSWLNIIKSWLDPKYQLITQPPPDYDGGDTANREGCFALAVHLLFKLGLCDLAEWHSVASRYCASLGLLEDPNHPGFLRRWPDPAYWGGQSDRFSRDQAIPNVIAMGFLDHTALLRFFWDHLKRGLLFTTNTRKNWAEPGTPAYSWKLPDLTILGFWSLYIRAFQAWYLYPLLLVFDLDFLVNSAIKVLIYGRNPANNDDLNHINCLLQAEAVMPTPWSKLAKMSYRLRPYPSLQPGQSASNSAQACLLAYFRGANPGPRLEEVYAPLTKYYLE